jgi:hypothetical protein
MKNPSELGGQTRMTVREHLAHFHKSAAATHRALAEAHGVAMAKESLGDDAQEFHKSCADVHAGAANWHDNAFAECSKAAEGDMNKVVPTGVSVVHSAAPEGITGVPRTGSRPMPAREEPNVPLEFQKLVAIDDENMERTHL